jgi:hypothetical protein
MGDRYGRRVGSAARFLADLIVHGVKSPRVDARIRCGCKRALLQWRAVRFIHAWSGVVATLALSSPGVASATGTGGAVTRTAIGAAAILPAGPPMPTRERRRRARRADAAERAARALRGAVGTARRTGGGRRLATRLVRRTRFATTRFAIARFAITRFATTRFAVARFAGTRFAITRFANARFASTRRTRRAARPRVRARRRLRTRGAGPGACARGLRVFRSVRNPVASVPALLPESFFCARRARFQALRVAAASLRARLASRFASLRRLRARLSSSLAMRTRCLATSACSRARSRGSAGGACSLPVFFIWGSRSERGAVSHKVPRVSTPGSYPQNLCITMWTDARASGKRRGHARACIVLSAISPDAALASALRASTHSPPALNMVAVTRLRPECLLR